MAARRRRRRRLKRVLQITEIAYPKPVQVDLH
jgi:hypothetical protein